MIGQVSCINILRSTGGSFGKANCLYTTRDAEGGKVVWPRRYISELASLGMQWLIPPHLTG